MKNLLGHLQTIKNNKEILDHLGKGYPALCIFIMEKRGMNKQLHQYMEKCKSLENDWKNYSLYVHGYWLPFLHQQISQGLLKRVEDKESIVLEIRGQSYKYEGYINADGEAFGFGKLKGHEYSNFGTTYTGTFKNNKIHGICKNSKRDKLSYS